MTGKRKAGASPWLGTEDQLCRAVKRLQTTSHSKSSSVSQPTTSEQCSVQGGKARVTNHLSHEGSFDEITSHLALSASISPAVHRGNDSPAEGAAKAPTVPEPQQNGVRQAASAQPLAFPHSGSPHSKPLIAKQKSGPAAASATPEPSQQMELQPAAKSQRHAQSDLCRAAPLPHLAASRALDTSAQLPAVSLTMKPAQPFAGQARMLFANPNTSPSKSIRVQHRAVRRHATAQQPNLPAGLTCNVTGAASSGNEADDEDSNSEVQQPSTPGREEVSSPGLQRTPARLGKRSGSTELEGSYTSLYEETNLLLKNLHFQRVKRIAVDRDV